MTLRRRWSFWMPPLEHPPILWLDDQYRGLLTDSGRLVLWGIAISTLSLFASGSYLIAILLGFSLAVLSLSFVFGAFTRPTALLEILRDEIPDGTEGNVVHYRVTVHNRGIHALKNVLVEERGMVPELRPINSPTKIDEIPPDESRTVILSMHCERRGVYSVERLQISSSLPTGFVKVGRSKRQKKFVTVHPIPTSKNWEKILAIPYHENSKSSFGTRLETCKELVGVRDWRLGDQVCDVHWRSTARRGRITSKEYAPQPAPTCSLLLDLEARTAKEEQRIDRMISIAASITQYLARKDFDLNVFCTKEDGISDHSLNHFNGLQPLLYALSSLESHRRGDLSTAVTALVEPARADLVVLLMVRMDSKRRQFVNEIRQTGCRLSVWVEGKSGIHSEWLEDDQMEIWS